MKGNKGASDRPAEAESSYRGDNQKRIGSEQGDRFLEKLWDRNITITTRLVDTITTPMLLKGVGSGRLQPRKLVTHRFALDDIMQAYEIFEHAATEGALKVILTNDTHG